MTHEYYADDDPVTIHVDGRSHTRTAREWASLVQLEGADDHPEHRCGKCGGRNIVWFAPSGLWNAVVRQPDGSDQWPVLCPICFAERADIVSAWRLAPEILAHQTPVIGERLVWLENDGPNSPAIYLTFDGRITICVLGHCITRTLAEWHVAQAIDQWMGYQPRPLPEGYQVVTEQIISPPPEGNLECCFGPMVIENWCKPAAVTIEPTDFLFEDSPEVGEATCRCSRCGEVIGESEIPVRAFDPETLGEYRYHPACVGVQVFDDDVPWENC